MQARQGLSPSSMWGSRASSQSRDDEEHLGRVTSSEVRGLIDDDNAQMIQRKTIRLPVAAQLILEVAITATPHDYSELLSYGYTAVIDAAYDDSNRSNHPFFNAPNRSLESLATWRSIGALILADMPFEMLQSILDGSLPRRLLGNDDADAGLRYHYDDSSLEAYYVAMATKAELPDVSSWVLRSKSTPCPCFYVRYITNASGESLTPRQLKQVIRCMRDYVSGDPKHIDLCVLVDNVSRGTRSSRNDIAVGAHHFLQGSAVRIGRVIAFCNALDNLLDQNKSDHPQAQDLPFKHLFKYVGYTENEADRTKRHNTGDTNFLQAFFTNICRIQFKGEDGVPLYNWRTYIVAFPISVEESKLGEELFCQMTQSYYHTGIGFNIAPAGISVESAVQMPQAEWQQKSKVRNSHFRYQKQLKEEVDVNLKRYMDNTNNKSKSKVDHAEQQRTTLIHQRGQLHEENIALEAEAIPIREMDASMHSLREEQKKLEEACPEDMPELKKLLVRTHNEIKGFIREYAAGLYTDTVRETQLSPLSGSSESG
ncbi:uncharacterized protein J4E92_001593 [Alternaria infectoria]|uniref:uncharacterized protein n=1 Tax=Alternaria infectoria TaxID=45303 RepID=UPI00221EAE4C|nr:uncharacterized protein J4E92_001593 [Alternaria infectoria]KAI4936868.1 hypothetical protein J4E92_001593 [Alternaria infectoria]